MSETTYAALITKIIDSQSDGYEYPDSFDADVEACFQQRLTPEQAADKLLAEYATA